jgi:hypothetical protein
MPSVRLSPLYNDQTFIPTTNTPASGYKLFTYVAGSSTKLATYTNSTGSTPQSNPIILNAAGQPDHPIWLAAGLSYKFVLTSPNDTDPPASVVKSFDDISGVNDSSSSVSQWQSSGVTPTYVSVSSFTVPGDQTNEFHTGRQAQFTVASGTVYGTIASSSYSAPDTTVTMAMDSGDELDNGLTSVELSILRADHPAMPATAISQCRGLTGTVNAGTPLSKFDLSADAVALRNLGGATLSRYNTGALTCDISLAGPLANGRDQADAFDADSWIYLYFIWNGSTLATLASVNAPSDFDGSTLPPGYTHWVFATSLRLDGSGDFIDSVVNGSWVFPDPVRVLTAGVATSYTSVDLSDVCPPNTVNARIAFQLAFVHNTANVTFELIIRPGGSSHTGVGICEIVTQVNGNSNKYLNTSDFLLGDAQDIEYHIGPSAPSGTGGAYIDVFGYSVPNGDA